MARARRRWIRKQGLLDPARLVFIDETATSTSLVRLRGRCPRGERLVGSVPHGHWKTITLSGLPRGVAVLDSGYGDSSELRADAVGIFLPFQVSNIKKSMLCRHPSTCSRLGKMN